MELNLFFLLLAYLNPSSFMVEDVISYRKTLNELKKMSFALEHEHKAYQINLAMETKYGSK